MGLFFVVGAGKSKSYSAAAREETGRGTHTSAGKRGRPVGLKKHTSTKTGSFSKR